MPDVLLSTTPSEAVGVATVDSPGGGTEAETKLGDAWELSGASCTNVPVGGGGAGDVLDEEDTASCLSLESGKLLEALPSTPSGGGGGTGAGGATVDSLCGGVAPTECCEA